MQVTAMNVFRCTSRLNPELIKSAVSSFEMIRIFAMVICLCMVNIFNRDDINLVINSIVNAIRNMCRVALCFACLLFVRTTVANEHYTHNNNNYNNNTFRSAVWKNC